MSPETSAEEDLSRVALERLARVLGAERAARLFPEVLSEASLSGIQTAQDLYTFGETLARRSGYEAAIGRLISIAAIVRGARSVR